MKADNTHGHLRMRGTRGSLWHWLSLSIIVVALIFFWAGRQDLPFIEKGKWQLDFLQQAVLPAEQEDLRVHLLARDAGKEAALSLAANGGFPLGSDSPCGRYKVTDTFGVNLWNKNDGVQEMPCFPDISSALEEEMASRLQDALPEHEFSGFGSHDRNVHATGGGKSIATEMGTYTYDDSFTIDIDYAFSDYNTVIGQADTLLRTCTGMLPIGNCVIHYPGTKPPNWHFGHSCGSDDIPPSAGPMGFCVQSSHIINGQRVEYHFALDFGS